MDYYRLTIPIPKRPWRWVRFRIATILLLFAIVSILLAWRRDHDRMADAIARLQYPSANYQASQAAGRPDVQSQGDSRLAWCPATQDGGEEWLLLEYDEAVTPSAIIVHENYVPGAVVKVTHVPALGFERTLWEGTYTPTTGATGSIARLPVATTIKTKRIKVYLDTAAAVGWNEIDAVGLAHGKGTVIWASEAEASSTWSHPRKDALQIGGLEDWSSGDFTY